MLKITGLILFAFMFFLNVQAQYISEVLEYKPAPGQFINSAPWGVPQSANSLVGGVTGSMSLGAFGGYVVFTFGNPVENHPDNPFGVDFTIFGNPLDERSEHGIVSVMKDENENGLPDDTWYELAGSEYFFSSTIKNYEVTYTNPNQAKAADVSWTDNRGNSGVVLANEFHSQPYYPITDSFPDVHAESYTLGGTRVADDVDRTNPSYVKSYRKAFGYVDNQLRGSAPYTVPDNPYTPEKENSGGDAFDINWAVDENGGYIDLDVIHFVKVHNAVLANASWLGEVSTEITGAVDVAPDNTITGTTKMLLIKDLPDTIVGTSYQIEAFAFDKGRWNQNAVINWSVNLPVAHIGHSNELVFSTSGELEITASLGEDASITATQNTVLVFNDNATVVNEWENSRITLYPNPATEQIFIEGAADSHIEIFGATGNKILETEIISTKQPVSVSHLSKGVYLVKISGGNINQTLRLIKN